MEIQTRALLAPVTALEFLHDEYLLTGEGPELTVFSLRPRPQRFANTSVLQHQRIHGIRPRNSVGKETSTCDQSSYDLAVFGGKAVRLVRLQPDQEDHRRLEMPGPLMELNDWVLDARWLPDQRLLVVGVAHNGVLLLDVSTGSVLSRRSCQEGCLLYSAHLLVHRSWPDTVVIGGTVFNQLVLWRTAEEGDHDAPVERRLLGHRGVIFSISYLPEEGLLASASDDRSVRVWAVGALGGPGGRAGDLNPTCVRVLFGHQARVFSVHLSPGRVFSAGEDGACIVWTRTGTVSRTLKGHRAGGIRALAVTGAPSERWVASGGADGGVRLWQVDEAQKDETSETLHDLKFSGLGTAKALCVAGRAETWGECEVVVCTDRGAVCVHRGGEWETLWRGDADFQSYCLMKTVSVHAGLDLCAVASLSGSVWIFPVSRPQSGVLLRAGSGKIHSLIWQRSGGSGGSGGSEGSEGSEGPEVLLLASGAEGVVYRWSFDARVDDDDSLHLNAVPRPPFLLPPCAKRWLTAAVHLHLRSLWVCGDRRGSLLLFQEGRKEGEEMTLKPSSVLFGVHGKAGVTSVCEHQGLLYSTGRDGCVRVFRVQLRDGERGLEVLRVQRACKGMEWLERVLFLSPEQEAGGDGSREARFVIVGFHAVHLVVWDPVRQERLLSVPCGGGHRSWTLWPVESGVWPGYGALVFIKQGSVLTSQPPVEMSSWAEETPGGLGLREGVHGRGLGCVCRLGRVRAEGGGFWEVVATGGEDTSVAVLAVNPDCGSFKVLSVITDHISSVRTMVAMTTQKLEKEDKSLSVLLVSASGRAQIHCYRLLVSSEDPGPTCQVIQAGRHRLDEAWERLRNRHKMVKMDPEPRYMSVALVGEKDGRVLLALACSDGAIRLFSVCEDQRKISLHWESFHHQRCVLSVATCCLEDGKGNCCTLMFSGATDGKIAAWMLTSPESHAPATPSLEVSAHQSGINDISLWKEDGNQSCLLTVVSGGDDGQLTASRIKVLYPGEDDGTFQLRLTGQTRVSLAHASPLTALKILEPGLVVTTSSDQRVCFWEVGSTLIDHKGALCSHVADAAGLAVWQEDEARSPELVHESSEGGLGGRAGWVLVCGQGLQLLRATMKKH